MIVKWRIWLHYYGFLTLGFLECFTAFHPHLCIKTRVDTALTVRCCYFPFLFDMFRKFDLLSAQSTPTAHFLEGDKELETIETPLTRRLSQTCCDIPAPCWILSSGSGYRPCHQNAVTLEQQIMNGLTSKSADIIGADSSDRHTFAAEADRLHSVYLVCE